METLQDTTVEEAQAPPPRPTPEEVHQLRQQLAKAEYDKLMANPPSRQVVRDFLNERAMAFIRENTHGFIPRSQRRKAAREIAKRAFKQAALGGK